MNPKTQKRLEKFTKRHDRIVELRNSLEKMKDARGHIDLTNDKTLLTGLGTIGRYTLTSICEMGNSVALGFQFVDLIARREEVNVKELFDSIVK